MGISIYKLFQLTFNDYKRDYNGYLTEFLNEYEDNTELYFIKEQKAILDDNLKKFKEVVMNLTEKDENQDEILDLFRNRINTTDRIKAFLEQRKQELEKELNLKVPAPKDIDSRNLTANQRALIMVYNDNTIVTRLEHGDDLYNKFTKWVKSQTRTADPDTTKLVLENKIKLFESIIPFLLEENKQKAIDEIKTLKLHLLKY
jgi:exonuclease VII small subunit